MDTQNPETPPPDRFGTGGQTPTEGDSRSESETEQSPAVRPSATGSPDDPSAGFQSPLPQQEQVPWEYLPPVQNGGPVPPPYAGPSMPASLPYTTPAPGCILREGTIYAPAGFAPRLWAFLLDAIVLGLLHQLLISIARVGTPDPEQMLKVVSQMVTELMRSGTISSALTSQMEDLESAARLIGWLNVGLCAAYYTIAHGMFGTTLGKYMLGLRVFRRDGNDLGLSLALLRYIGYLLSAKLIYTAWFIPFNPEKRTLYDMIFSTNVFRPVAKFNPAPPPPEYYG